MSTVSASRQEEPQHTYLLLSVRSALPKTSAVEKILQHLKDIEDEVEVHPLTSFGWLGKANTEVFHYGGKS